MKNSVLIVTALLLICCGYVTVFADPSQHEIGTVGKIVESAKEVPAPSAPAYLATQIRRASSYLSVGETDTAALRGVTFNQRRIGSSANPYGPMHLADPLSTGAATAVGVSAAAGNAHLQTDVDRAEIPVPEVVPVEGGTFQMGYTDGDPDEKVVHTVTLSSFNIGKYPVTFDQYDAFCDDIGHLKPDDGGWGRCDRPVLNISWEAASAYCKWLTIRTGHTYRLPTEAEWEFAARGGGRSQGATYSGGNNIDSVAWYFSNASHKTHPVGQKAPNELGIYDMTGNVWEWCSDWYGADYYASSPKDDPKGPDSGSHRVIRGGSVASSAAVCRTTNRSKKDPESRDNNYGGFRVVLVE